MATVLEQELTDQLKVAMKGGDKVGTSAIRMVRTKIMEKRTAKNATEVKDEDIVDIIRAYAKMMQGSIDELVAGGADQDEVNIVQMRHEIVFLDRFLPKLLDEAGTQALVDAAVAANPGADAKQAGKITGAIMKDNKGKVDPGLVAKLVKQKLGG